MGECRTGCGGSSKSPRFSCGREGDGNLPRACGCSWFLFTESAGGQSKAPRPIKTFCSCQRASRPKKTAKKTV